MVDRYPAHPLTADACRWLIRHDTSSEARRRHELGQFLALTQVEFEASPRPRLTPPRPEKPMPRGRRRRPTAEKKDQGSR